MTWYSKDLGDGVQAFQPSFELQELFMAFFSAAGLPHEMALFSKYDLKRNIVTVYFTPAAKDVATAVGGEACDKPDRDRLGLLVGDQRVLEIFYPGEFGRST